MTENEFYQYLKANLNKLANLYNVTNLDEYYYNTDLENEKIANLNGINQAFAQFVLHAQNATMISGIVNFDKNYDSIKSILKNFNPNEILSFYKIDLDSEENVDSVKLLVEAFRRHLNWTTNKSSKPDSIITRFANSIIDGAKYFSNFSSKDELIKDLCAHYSNNNYRELINYFQSHIKHGFSVALCCDFLKELNPCFDLPKPDVHLMDVIAKYKGYDSTYYKSTRNRAFKCIDDIVEIVTKVKNDKNGDQTLTVYKFDRMVWLCCTANFFLNNSGKSLKENLLNGIN